jgi:putative ABC transport system substrate-binding protein
MSIARALPKLVILCIMTYALCGVALAADATVWIALADTGPGPYAEAAEAIRAELRRGAGGADIVVRPWREFVAGNAAPPRLVVAVGVAALRGVVESGVKGPLVATLVPRAAYARFADAAGARTATAVWLDQPMTRQLDLLRLALPERRRVGVLLGPESRIFDTDLRHAAADRNQTVAAEYVEAPSQLPGALQQALEGADVLLALPDPQIYNSATIQDVLMAAYRRRVPMAGFSPAYVRAGALLALYSTPAQIGAQVGEIVRGFLAGRPLPPAQGPREFSVSVNADVARSLGIPVDADAAARWAEQLRAKEKAP